MKKWLMASGIAVVSLAAFGFWQNLRIQDLEAQLATLQEANARWSEESRQQSESHDKRIAELQQQVKEQQQLVEAAKAQGTRPLAAAPDAPRAVAAVNTPPTVSTSAASLMASPDFQQNMAQRQFMTRFGGLLSALKLSPDKERELKNRLTTIMAKGYALNGKVSSGELGQEEARNLAKSYQSEMEQTLAENLTAEQMNAYRAYEAERPARERQQQITARAAQMATTAPGLSEDSRSMIASLMVETQSKPPKLQNGENIMVVINDEVENKLQGKLSDDQMRIARDYLRNESRMQTIMLQNSRAAQGLK